MNVEKMTERVSEALNAAYSRALAEHNTQTAPEHMLPRCSNKSVVSRAIS